MALRAFPPCLGLPFGVLFRWGRGFLGCLGRLWCGGSLLGGRVGGCLAGVLLGGSSGLPSRFPRVVCFLTTRPWPPARSDIA